MAKFIVTGGAELTGEVTPVGNKNAVLKLIPASILFSGDYTLTNVPAITDVDVMLQILEEMGAAVDYSKDTGTVTINTDNLNTYIVPSDLAKKLRASVVFIGPLLARFGKVKSLFPGGDKIGSRELKAHFQSLNQLGAVVTGNEWGEFEVSGNLHPGTVYLYEPSVTATENVILAASKLNGTSTIVGAACEPHVKELCMWLQENGVQIQGIGSNIITISGISEIKTAGKTHSVWPDYLDVGAYAVAAAITNSELRIKNVRHEDLITINFFYEQLGLKLQAQGGDLLISKNQPLQVRDLVWGRTKGIYSQPWYGFPSDLMSITIALSMSVEGSTLFFEKLYSDRLSFVSYFNAAGGNIVQCDPHRIVVNGRTQLKGFNYIAPDIRAGMAYFLAALGAEGVSEINAAEHIDRAYPNTLENFQRIGAKVERID